MMSTTRLLISCVLCVLAAETSAQQDAGKGVCCGDLGCYSPGGDFFAIPHRPLNSIPDCSLTGRLFLRLNTRKNPQLTQILTPYEVSTITDSNFNPKQQTKILIHGFLDRYTRPGWKTSMENLLKDGDHNVIRVDWSQGNTPPYIQACANLRLVGAYVAKFIQTIITQLQVNPKDVHIIGHSLGAHGAGYAGSLMQTLYNTSIGRITGLDPAGPYFTHMPTSVRLDPTDADFVDTVVTNGDIIDAFGSPQPMGHINFYPNGGMNQPGCSPPLASSLLNTQALLNAAPRRVAAAAAARDATGNVIPGAVVMTASDVANSGIAVASTSFDKLGSLFEHDASAAATAARTAPLPPGVFPEAAPRSIIPPRFAAPDALDLVGCSHNRAVLYFADSIANDSCVMKGFQCDSYDLFLESDGGCGECFNSNNVTTCSPMGLHANPSLAVKNRVKRFYTVTRANSPYCSKLKVQFTLKGASPTEKDNKPAVGSIYITLYGSLSTTEKMLVSKPEDIDLIPGKSYSFYPEISKNLGQIQSIGLFWKPKSNSILPFGIFSKTEYLFLDGDILSTDQDGIVSVFTPARPKFESNKDLNARFVREHEEK